MNKATWVAATTGLCLQEWSKDEWSLGKCDDSAKGLGGFWKAKVTWKGAGGASSYVIWSYLQLLKQEDR